MATCANSRQMPACCENLAILFASAINWALLIRESRSAYEGRVKRCVTLFRRTAATAPLICFRSRKDSGACKCLARRASGEQHGAGAGNFTKVWNSCIANIT